MQKHVTRSVVFLYLEFDPATKRYAVSRAYATEPAIAAMLGLPIPESAVEVDASAIDAQGFLRKDYRAKRRLFESR
jgi:hypothetical protein